MKKEDDDKVKAFVKRDITHDTFEVMYNNLLTYGILFPELTGREQNMLMALADRYSDAIYEIVMKNRKVEKEDYDQG
jgi:hypothetical protein